MDTPKYLFGLRITVPYASSKKHQHGNWELALYTSGTGVATIGSECVALRPGTIVCYPPDLPHHENATVPLTGYFVHVAGLRLPARPVATGVDSSDHLVERLIAMLIDLGLQRTAADERIIDALFDVLLLKIHASLTRGETHPRVASLKRALYARFREPGFGVGDAMRAEPMAKDHLRRLFTAEVGMTPQRYLSDLRVNEAKNLLAFGYSVKEAAARVGFPDQHYFSRAFHRITGLRPSAHRRDASREEDSA